MTQSSDPPLLAYFIDTEQSSLNPGEFGYITVWVAPGFNNQVQSDQIVFTVPFGGANDIFSDKPGVSNENPATGSWSINSPKKVPTENTVTITLDSDFHNDLVNQTFSFRIEGTVQKFGASSSISFVEHSTVSGDGQPVFTAKDGSLLVQGHTAGVPALTITSFIAQLATLTNTDSQLIPITEFTSDTPFNLIWSAKEATSYEVYQGSNAKPIYTGSETTVAIHSGISQATTFTLVATNKNGETDICTLTVTVINPWYTDLEVSKNTKLGFNRVHQSVLVNASLEATGSATVSEGVTVYGASTLEGTTMGSLYVKGETKAHGNLTAKQTSYLAATNISGESSLPSALNVDGASTLQDAEVGGDLTVKGKGGKTKTGEGVVTNGNMVVSNCFSMDYRYYEVILENILPSEDNAYLEAQYQLGSGWGFENSYSVEAYSNDSGGNNADSYLNRSVMHLWPHSRTGVSKNAGVFGSMTFYNPTGIGYTTSDYSTTYLNYTGLLYGPYAHDGYGCQVYSAGSYAMTNYYDRPPYATGIQFFFNVANVVSGTVRVYGWN